MDNLELWNKVSRPPANALRQIMGGRLNGKTDIKPQWRYQVMTEQFGPCGIGWKYTIDRLWTEPGSDNQVFAFALVSVYIKHDGAWSEAIPGQGGSMLVEKEKAGLFSSDEGFKMAITDAISVALKMLGVAGEIYMGNWDGAKYKDAPAPGKAPEKKPDPVVTKRTQTIELFNESKPKMSDTQIEQIRGELTHAGTVDAMLDQIATKVRAIVAEYDRVKAEAEGLF